MSTKEQKGGDVLDGELVFAAARDVALLEQLFAVLAARVTDRPVVNRDNVVQVVTELLGVASAASRKLEAQNHILNAIGHTLQLLPREGQ